MYADDNEEALPVSSRAPATGYSDRWHLETAEYTGAEWSDYSDIRVVETIYECPAFDRSARTFTDAWTVNWDTTAFHIGGIAFNNKRMGAFSLEDAQAIKPTEVDNYRRRKLAEVTRPEQTVLIGDSKDSGKGSAGPGEQTGLLQWPSGALYDSYNHPLIGLRHRMGMNFGWVDGHVSWSEPLLVPITMYFPNQ